MPHVSSLPNSQFNITPIVVNGPNMFKKIIKPSRHAAWARRFGLDLLESIKNSTLSFPIKISSTRNPPQTFSRLGALDVINGPAFSRTHSAKDQWDQMLE